MSDSQSNLIARQRCWAEIDLGALRHNAEVVQGLVGSSVGIMAIVKADAYGHGMQPVVRTLAPLAAMFGVACLAEACQVRVAAPDSPIFILGPALAEERAEILEQGFIPNISTLEEGLAFAAAAPTGRDAVVHLAIDTGMGRVGVWKADAVELLRALRSIPNLTISGVATHLPSADEDAEFTRHQLADYDALRAQLCEVDPDIRISHSLNSAGIIAFNPCAGSIVRAGLLLYGVSPVADFQPRIRPILSLKTRVTLVREMGAGRSISYGRSYITPRPMRVATLAIGYADGYPRILSNQNVHVLIRGQRCAVLGRVTMDQILVDITALPTIVPGEEVILLGRSGNEEVSSVELAEKASTIPWEILTGIQGRVTRLYHS